MGSGRLFFFLLCSLRSFVFVCDLRGGEIDRESERKEVRATGERSYACAFSFLSPPPSPTAFFPSGPPVPPLCPFPRRCSFPRRYPFPRRCCVLVRVWVLRARSLRAVTAADTTTNKKSATAFIFFQLFLD